MKLLTVPQTHFLVPVLWVFLPLPTSHSNTPPGLHLHQHVLHPPKWLVPCRPPDSRLTPPPPGFLWCTSVPYLFENRWQLLSVLHFLSHHLRFILPMALNPFGEDFHVSLWAPQCLTTEGKTTMSNQKCLIIYVFICARRDREERHKK